MGRYIAIELTRLQGTNTETESDRVVQRIRQTQDFARFKFEILVVVILIGVMGNIIADSLLALDYLRLYFSSLVTALIALVTMNYLGLFFKTNTRTKLVFSYRLSGLTNSVVARDAVLQSLWTSIKTWLGEYDRSDISRLSQISIRPRIIRSRLIVERPEFTGSGVQIIGEKEFLARVRSLDAEFRYVGIQNHMLRRTEGDIVATQIRIDLLAGEESSNSVLVSVEIRVEIPNPNHPESDELSIEFGRIVETLTTRFEPLMLAQAQQQAG